MIDIALQRKYYDRTSAKFDEMHLGDAGDIEHVLACQLIVAFLQPRHPSASILDIGAGTGRFYRFLRENCPNSNFNVMGIEPSEAQRRKAYENGVPPEKHLAGDATQLDFSDNSFDYCTEFGVVHHIRDYRKAVREMCRIASKGIFLSDSNKYGQGSLPKRLAKNALRLTGTWGIMDYIKSGGRGYQYSEGDGVYYSFSAFEVTEIVRKKFPFIYAWPTKPIASPNLFMGCSQVLVLAHS